MPAQISPDQRKERILQILWPMTT